MVDFFVRLYGIERTENSFYPIVLLHKILRVSLRIVTNAWIPFWYKISSGGRLEKSHNSPLVIVSLTCFPARINKVWIVIECLLRQKQLPDRIILWLSNEQFEDLDVLPKNLLRLKERGLEIFICEGDIKSHKKYFYTLTKFPGDILITVDDDIFYDSGLTKDLLDLHRQFPYAICCNRALEMEIKSDEIAPYSKWKVVRRAYGPSFKLFQTSGGGTLFPPGSLPKQTLEKSVFMKYCKYADDVWLNVMSQMNNTKIIKSNRVVGFIPIFNIKNSTLMDINVNQGENDRQLVAVRDYYVNKLGQDPMRNLFTKKVF
jgi:hypothetical protein